MENTKYKLKVEMIVEVEIDNQDEVVNDYDSDSELLEHIVSYRFSSILPVMKKGVRANFEEITFKILDR